MAFKIGRRQFLSGILFSGAAKALAPHLGIDRNHSIQSDPPRSVETPAETALGKRRILSLDGRWEIAQGGMDTEPTEYAATVPVPGLADLAAPAFQNVGVESPERQAFWYRRRFLLKGPVSVAQLKVNKAQFGAKVWVNGAPAGEHLGCFTPGRFDVSRLLRADAENTIVIRIGAWKNALPDWVPPGTDYERIKWIPGIYDSVSLTLMESPFITGLQVAPNIEKSRIEVQVSLQNSEPTTARPNIQFSVREWKSGQPAAKSETKSVEIGPNSGKTITTSIHLENPTHWSPENPFLYVLRCDTGADTLEARFGMREYHNDVRSGYVRLNGMTYFLRGSNFCMFRFFEDPKRAGLPWDREWVRKLLELPKRELHLNSARVCIAPFPEFWYDLADEIGWLLQDEYPIWGFDERWSDQELITEFREWLQERWNHPSIVVWDACNETLEPRLAKIIETVRPMDLSNRPWDNGYSPPIQIGDAVEVHPYLYIRDGFRLYELGSALEKKQVDTILRPSPVVINEYDWLWVNRDGTPTRLTEALYAARLGPDAAPAERWEFCAYHYAVLTEFWRATRLAAAVQYFCYLTYSRPGGQTSDNFVDIQNLTLEPRFREYMRNAESPLGVMIDDYTEKVGSGVKRSVRIIITNDLYRRRGGRIRFKITDPSESLTLWETTTPFEVEPLGQQIKQIPAEYPVPLGRYHLVADMAAKTGETVKSFRKFEVISSEEAQRLTDLALGCRTSASSFINDARGDYPPRFAVDGSWFSRWSSQFSDPQWLAVDLGRVQQISRVVLYWETAYGKSYRIQVSTDGKRWQNVYSTHSGKGGIETIRFQPVEARWVRMDGIARGTQFGYSLWEFQVFAR